ncbi:hypothetical protein ACER0A_003190 [Haloimpatiens sp. FM7315]|uniref:hypothetical protein n=1 Tax=Haloimpatiens sp. FM7315 TaxID=3298609 RepID=UPI00370BFDF3
MKTFMTILQIIAFSIIMLVIYNLLRKYVLTKINVKHKWILIVLGVLCIFIQSYLTASPYSPVAIFLSGLSVLFLLWFMDAKGLLKGSNAQKTSKDSIKYVSPYDNKKNKKKEVIKPKAKANKAMKNDK